MNEWYKDWFASEFYLKVYSHRNNSDAENILKLILNNVDIPVNAKVLDAACGNGRHAKKFAELGYNVVGFDLSKTLLKIAQKKRGNNLNYFCSDIRSLPVKTSFDLILNLFTSFGYFNTDKENFTFIKNSNTLLSKNGYFIFDYLNPTYVETNLVKKSEKKIDNIKIVENRNINQNRVEKEIIISEDENRYRYFESVQLYSYATITKMFDKYGFEPHKTFGDYLGSDYYKDSSARMIIVFKKKM